MKGQCRVVRFRLNATEPLIEISKILETLGCRSRQSGGQMFFWRTKEMSSTLNLQFEDVTGTEKESITFSTLQVIQIHNHN